MQCVKYAAVKDELKTALINICFSMNVVVIKQVTKEKNNRIDVGTTIFSNLNIEIWSLVGEERYGFLHI